MAITKRGKRSFLPRQKKGSIASRKNRASLRHSQKADAAREVGGEKRGGGLQTNPTSPPNAGESHYFSRRGRRPRLVLKHARKENRSSPACKGEKRGGYHHWKFLPSTYPWDPRTSLVSREGRGEGYSCRSTSRREKMITLGGLTKPTGEEEVFFKKGY